LSLWREAEFASPFLWMLMVEISAHWAATAWADCGRPWSAVMLGPNIIFDYLHNMWTLPHILRTTHPLRITGILLRSLDHCLGSDYVNFANQVHLIAVAMDVLVLSGDSSPKVALDMQVR